MKFLTSAIEGSHDKDSEIVQSMIVALGNLLRAPATKKFMHFVCIYHYASIPPFFDLFVYIIHFILFDHGSHPSDSSN